MKCVEARDDTCLPLVSESAKFKIHRGPEGKEGWRSHRINLGGVVVIEQVCRGIDDVVV